jgi:uncharacterized cupredoxin-like copper-binding protein
MKGTTLAIGAAVAALAVAACGSSSKSNSTTAPTTSSSAPASTPTSAPSGGAGAVSLSADPTGALKFNKSSATVKAGKVTLTMSNPSPISHGVAVQGAGVDKSGQIVAHGGTSTVTVTLKPGKYTFFCPVPGHRQAGMQGTLTVTG